MNSQQGVGWLQVRVVTAGGALGVEGAQVLIFGPDAAGVDAGVIYSLRTDSSGLAPRVALPAPPRSLSLSPEDDGAPSTLYHVKVSKEKFNSVEITGVPVFTGITSLQKVTLLPEDEFAVLSPGYPMEFTQIFDVPPESESV